MAGLLGDWSGFVGDDTTKDEFGMTQADRREPLWSGLIKAGLLAVAGGGNLMPEQRAQYLAQAGGALADIPQQMISNRSAAAQQALRAQQIKSSQTEQALRTQQIKSGQAELAQQEKWRVYADSPEFQKAMDDAQATQAERMAAKAAAMKGDFASVQKILDPRRNKPTVQGGNVVYPNGDVWNQLTGWIIKDGKPVSYTGDQTTPPPTPQQTQQPPIDPATGKPMDIDKEIQGWSSMPANAGIPHGLQPSPFDEPRNYAVLGRLDPSVARIVQQMGDYETEPGKAYGRFSNPELLKLVNAYNPGFKQGQYKLINDQNLEYSAKGATGKSMLAMDTSYAHIGSLWKQYEALSGPDTPAARAVLQEVQRRLGLPSTAGFDVARSAVADEVAKAMRGSGALNQSEQEEWSKKYDPTKSPEQFQRAIVETMELLEGKEKAIKNKYKTDTGLVRKDFLSAENKALAQHIRANPLGGGGGYVGPDGKSVSAQDIADTAKAEGITSDQVIKKYGLKPGGK